MPVLETALLSQSGPVYGPDGSRTYKEVWNARTDQLESWQTVANEIGIVQYQTAYPYDMFALATEITGCEPHEDDENYWTVEYKYTTKLDQLAQVSLAAGGGGSPGPGSGHNPDEPLTWAPKVRWSTKMFKRVVFRDLDGRLYANGAGELFEPAMREYPRLVLNVQRNIATFDEKLLTKVTNAVNGEECIGYAAGQIKCERLSAEPQYDKQRYWKVEGEFIIGAPTDINATIWPGIPANAWWHDKRLNAGYQTRGYDGTLAPILIRGQKPSRPVPLTTDGVYPAALADPPESPNFLYFRELPWENFNATGLFDP